MFCFVSIQSILFQTQFLFLFQYFSSNGYASLILCNIFRLMIAPRQMWKPIYIAPCMTQKKSPRPRGRVGLIRGAQRLRQKRSPIRPLCSGLFFFVIQGAIQMGFHTYPPAIIGLNRFHKIKETQLNHWRKSIGTKIKTECGASPSDFCRKKL